MVFVFFSQAPIRLRECFIALNPVRFSESMLARMDVLVPSHLPGHEGLPGPQAKVILHAHSSFCFAPSSNINRSQCL